MLRPEQIRLIPERQALVVAENAPPLIAQLRRCLDGRAGRALLERQRAARDQVGADRQELADVDARTAVAVAYSQQHQLHPSDSSGHPTGTAGFDDRKAWTW